MLDGSKRIEGKNRKRREEKRREEEGGGGEKGREEKRRRGREKRRRRRRHKKEGRQTHPRRPSIKVHNPQLVKVLLRLPFQEVLEDPVGDLVQRIAAAPAFLLAYGLYAPL